MGGFILVDTETNGIYKYELPADHPAQPRVAELGMLVLDDAFQIERQHSWLWKRDGWSMTPEASAINGITDAMLDADGLDPADICEAYAAEILAGRAVLGWNARFDVKGMRGELRRLHPGDPTADLFKVTPNWDIQKPAADLCKVAPTNAMMATGRKTFKKPRLGEAYNILIGRPMDRAHRALSDCLASHAILLKLIERGVKPDPKVHFTENPDGKAAQALGARPGMFS